jgi:hypothetical protein
MTKREHIYRGIRVRDTNEWGDVYDVRAVVLVDDQPLPTSECGKQKSPTGMEWGYGGSGPAATAHSILTYEFGTEIANQYFQHFKWQVIAGLDSDRRGQSWQLTSADIQHWLDQQHDRAESSTEE